jgi:hypothetical protein
MVRLAANFGTIECPRVVRPTVFINPDGSALRPIDLPLRPAEACLAAAHLRIITGTMSDLNGIEFVSHYAERIAKRPRFQTIISIWK